MLSILPSLSFNSLVRKSSVSIYSNILWSIEDGIVLLCWQWKSGEVTTLKIGMALLMHHIFVAVAVAVAVAIVDDVAIAIAIAIATYNILPSLSSLCCQECSTVQ